MSQVRVEIYPKEDTPIAMSCHMNNILEKKDVHFMELKEMCGKMFLVYRLGKKKRGIK